MSKSKSISPENPQLHTCLFGTGEHIGETHSCGEWDWHHYIYNPYLLKDGSLNHCCKITANLHFLAPSDQQVWLLTTFCPEFLKYSIETMQNQPQQLTCIARCFGSFGSNDVPLILFMVHVECRWLPNLDHPLPSWKIDKNNTKKRTERVPSSVPTMFAGALLAWVVGWWDAHFLHFLSQNMCWADCDHPRAAHPLLGNSRFIHYWELLDIIWICYHYPLMRPAMLRSCCILPTNFVKKKLPRIHEASVKDPPLSWPLFWPQEMHQSRWWV